MRLILIMNAAKNVAWLMKNFDFFISMKSIQTAFAYLKLNRQIRFFLIILIVFRSAESSFFSNLFSMTFNEIWSISINWSKSISEIFFFVAESRFYY